jgi:hypothetical protein
MGIQHPDDMSSIILNSFHRHLNDRLIVLKEQTIVYKLFWDLQKDAATDSTTEER